MKAGKGRECSGKGRLGLGDRLGEALRKTVRGFGQMVPIMVGVILLVSLAAAALPEEFYSSLFTGNVLVDSLAGAVLGSIAAGNPVTSYLIGGELLARGISLVAITAFILAWVTVGVVTFPAESMIIGRRFAISRNVVSFFLSIAAAILVVFTLGVLG